MNKITKAFENIWKIKLMQGCKPSDKQIYYDVFTLGYGCALIDLDELSEKSPITHQSKKEVKKDESKI